MYILIQYFHQVASAGNHKEYAVMIAKSTTVGGFITDERGYPTLPQYIYSRINQQEIEPALVHAIIRQESMFDTEAASPVGALGLMQLMPDTARSVAGRLGMQYQKARLVKNPDYNVSLGSAYLAQRTRDFGGSYVLAIASYNAGIGNVKKWLESNGDIRGAKDLDEVIDWMEMIPFKETRNYVQRVTEALQVYRYVLGHGKYKPVNQLADDLTRK